MQMHQCLVAKKTAQLQTARELIAHFFRVCQTAELAMREDIVAGLQSQLRDEYRRDGRKVMEYTRGWEFSRQVTPITLESEEWLAAWRKRLDKLVADRDLLLGDQLQLRYRWWTQIVDSRAFDDAWQMTAAEIIATEGYHVQARVDKPMLGRSFRVSVLRPYTPEERAVQQREINAECEKYDQEREQRAKLIELAQPAFARMARNLLDEVMRLFADWDPQQAAINDRVCFEWQVPVEGNERLQRGLLEYASIFGPEGCRANAPEITRWLVEISKEEIVAKLEVLLQELFPKEMTYVMCQRTVDTFGGIIRWQ